MDAATVGTDTDDVRRYFRDKAATYDLVDRQAYWRLSDELLWRAVEAHALAHLPAELTFLDAGGGTGRWSDRVLRRFPAATGVLFDLSPEMISQAVQKAERGGYHDRLRLVEGDLAEVAAALSPATFDLVLSLHNVLGFVADVDAVTAQLAGLLRPSGRLVLFVPNQHHLAFFNLLHCRVAEAAAALRTGSGRFTEDMPPVRLFTPTSLRRLLHAHGLRPELVTGFPVLVYPGFQETQREGSSELVVRLLEGEGFERILSLEEAVMYDPDVAGRGNNLFAVGRKPADGESGT